MENRLAQRQPGASVHRVEIDVTARDLADLPELGTLNRQEISALVGLAPFPDDSGTRTVLTTRVST